MSDQFESGYNHAIRCMVGEHGANQAKEYIQDVSDAIHILEGRINSFNGYLTQEGQLQGDIAEYWHGETFNINAVLNSSSYRATVDRSHDFASADIKTNWGEDYGLKYLKFHDCSVNAQATNYFEKFAKYRHSIGNPNLTFDEYITVKGLPEDIFLSDPIYSGQTRLIPADQLEMAKEYLRFKIAKESITRPEHVKRYQDVLDHLTQKIKSPDGVESIELTRTQSEELTRLAKLGNFEAEACGISVEHLVKVRHILNKGIEAGTTAAIMSLVFSMAPEIYKCISSLISEGEIYEERFRQLGFAAIKGGGGGFLRGFVAASLTACCETGMLGGTLQNVHPSIIGALTMIMMNTMKDSYLVIKGTLSKNELAANLSRSIIVAGCGIGGAALLQLLAPTIPFAYLLGNFVGSFVGSFAYIAYEKAFLSYCVVNGWTMFGVVDQNYELPDEVLSKLGFNIYELEELELSLLNCNEFSFFEYSFEKFESEMIRILQRGVIGVWQIGYTF